MLYASGCGLVWCLGLGVLVVFWGICLVCFVWVWLFIGCWMFLFLNCFFGVVLLLFCLRFGCFGWSDCFKLILLGIMGFGFVVSGVCGFWFVVCALWVGVWVVLGFGWDLVGLLSFWLGGVGVFLVWGVWGLVGEFLLVVCWVGFLFLGLWFAGGGLGGLGLGGLGLVVCGCDLWVGFGWWVLGVPWGFMI